jgi:hypothetical protein
MPVFIPAQATCDRCGKTAPCWLSCIFDGTIGVGDRRFEKLGATVRGLGKWFWKDDGVVCSEACKEAIQMDPRYAGFSGEWMACAE